MAGSSASTEMTFSVHPSVVFKLGEDLITDDIQALTELVKNSYDADAQGVEIEIDTHSWSDLRTGQALSPVDAESLRGARARLEKVVSNLELVLEKDPEDKEAREALDAARQELARLQIPVQGRITVADSGTGMSMDDVELGWLTVSASRKRAMKERGETTADFKRTPLGDKGLGRLGAQRLGRALDLTTRQAAGDRSIHATIIWDDFLKVDSLSRVPITVRQVDDNAAIGTDITIRGLRAADQWRNKTRLLRDLSEMISPYSDQFGFDIELTIDDLPIDLRQQSREILKDSAVTYGLDYTDQIFRVTGEMNVEYLRPDNGQDKIALWNELVHADNGHSFLEFLLATEPDKSKNLSIQHGSDGRFCTFAAESSLAFFPDVERVDDELADPGNFDGRVDVIQRRRAASVFDSQADFKLWIEAVSGVRLYRNGFGIRLRRDWLNLASAWTSGSSFYTIRPDNVIGYINLTAAGNAALEETSNREDIRDTAAYRNFLRLINRWLQETESFQSLLRRTYNEYVKTKQAESQGVSAGSSPRELATEVEASFEAIADVSNTVVSTSASVQASRTAVAELHATQDAIAEVVEIPPELLAANQRAFEAVTAAIESIQTEVTRARELSEQLKNRRGIVDILAGRLEEAERQVRDVWELVSLGITAETIAHEVINVTDRLRTQSDFAAKYNDANTQDDEFAEYIEQVRNASRSMASQVSHLDSSLRYMRDRKDKIRVSKLVAGNVRYFEQRWADRPLAIEVNVVRDFDVRISKGRFSQVVDNLLLNSEFWMESSVTANRIVSGVVTIEIAAPFVIIYDNGPGIDKSVDEILFDPFVTRKPARLGRGLGLFVVQQLLDADGATITLDVERNGLGNRYRFRIDLEDLTGAQRG